MSALLITAFMTCHPFTCMEALYCGRCDADVYAFPCQAMGNTVEMAVDLHVIINMNFGLFPFGKLIWLCGQAEYVNENETPFVLN
jgi:hypothetical protein